MEDDGGCSSIPLFGLNIDSCGKVHLALLQRGFDLDQRSTLGVELLAAIIHQSVSDTFHILIN